MSAAPERAPLVAEPLTAGAFAPFGEVLEATGAHVLINEGRCRRYSDLAALDIAHGRAGVSFFAAEPRTWPVEVPLVERHPLGSQCFVPMSGGDWLVVVAGNGPEGPEGLRAFLARGDQGVNIARDTWHGVLCPLGDAGTTVPRLFAVVDRIGTEGEPAGANLVEHRFAAPLTVHPGA
ncbi:Ureidoglycolate hydrolase [Rhodovulum sp. 12E13]|uniref:ureidoglycolate lyase n=1 Tax=Rhodovulum sp. 12E13 TaxID=2203891 RepID=UPI000E1AC84C|nr:ureidoglycolate lyase [Rhodovulum sp. 12E13]RDC71348.1 Ureidoglycolate hydrolase [Rhodovulum sp. 12E13]